MRLRSGYRYRRWGRYRVYIQNMQGGSNFGYAIAQIRRHDIVLLQESGSIVGRLGHATIDRYGNHVGTRDFGTRARPCVRHFIHFENGRCSMTILVSDDLGRPRGFRVQPPSPTLRPMLGAFVDGMAFTCFHAPSGNHNAAAGVLRSMLRRLRRRHRRFIAGGDANSDITQQNIARVQSTFRLSGATHMGGGRLDGFVTSSQFNGTLTSVGSSGSDHIGASGDFMG